MISYSCESGLLWLLFHKLFHYMKELFHLSQALSLHERAHERTAIMMGLVSTYTGMIVGKDSNVKKSDFLKFETIGSACSNKI